MKNPWKRYSKINPQRENGNRQICNDVYHALLSGDFTGAEYKIIFSIIDKTWGFNKQSDIISINQLCEMTNLAKRTVQRTVKALKIKRVVYMSPSKLRASTGSPLNNYSVNKHYDTWKVKGCQIVQGCQPDHPFQDDKGDQNGKTRVSTRPPTKESNTKERKKDTAFDNAEIYITKNKKKITGKRLETFMLFWEAFNYKRGKAEATDVWLDIQPLTNSIVERIIATARKESQRRPDLRKNDITPKMAQGWLSGKRWEDEIESPKQTEKIYEE